MINREKAKLHVLNSYLDNNLKNIELTTLDDIYSLFETEYYQNHFYKYVFERFSESKGLHYTIINYAIKFSTKIENCTMPFQNKVYCFVLLYQIVSKNEQIRYSKNRYIKQKIDNFWQKIADDWNKVNMGFFICSELAEIDLAYAKNTFTKSEKLKKESWIATENTSKTYVDSISIVIKSFTGLAIMGVNSKTHFKSLETLINRIPSEIERLELWTEAAFNMLLEKKHEIAQSIYDNHVLPLLQGVILERENYSLCEKPLVLTHYYNQELANDYINQIENLSRDEIYHKISDFYITKKNPFEIYDDELSSYNCSHNDILKSISILEKITMDVLIYSVIDKIFRVVNDKSCNFTSTQKKDICHKLLEHVNSKLPDLTNIKHDGYKIISKIKIALITKNNSDWKNLYDETLTITNFSDKIFIKSNLLENIPSDKFKFITKGDLFDEIVLDLKNLNNNYEYIERINDISDVMYSANKTKWKEIVQNAFSLTKKIEHQNISYKYQKSIIDTMFRLDSAFSKELLNSIENKDSMKSAYLKDYYMSLEISKKIKNNQSIEHKETENARVILRGIIKTLAAFNSGKLTIRKPDEMNKYLHIGCKIPLNESLALYHYYFANCNRHTPPKNLENKYGDFLIKLYEDVIKSTNLIEILATNKKNFNVIMDLNDISTNYTAKPGTREEAMKYIQGWMNDEVDEFLIFADPYWQAKDIEFAKLLKQVDKENININILTHKHIDPSEIEKEWNKISSENIPYINITFCNIQNENKCPFHDRWILTKNGGLRLGTSFNSIGISRDSEISVMKAIDSDNIYNNILKDYINRTKREHNFQKISYQSYST